MKHISEVLPEALGHVTQPDPTDPARVRVCPPCDGNCRQGRDCPAPVADYEEGWLLRLVPKGAGMRFIAAWIAVCCCFLVGSCGFAIVNILRSAR